MRVTGYVVYIFCVGAAVFLFSCCCFSGTTEVTLSLPQLPSAWKQNLGEPEVVYVFPSVSEEDGDFKIVTLPQWHTPLNIRVPKENNLPVLAYPQYQGVKMKPAGGIVPNDVTEEKYVLLSWEHGFIAELLKRLYYTSHSAAVINIDRLTKEIGEKSEDPWAVDMDRIAESLQFACFSANAVDVKETGSFSIDAAPGKWISSNPFMYPCTADKNGLLSLDALYPGFHRFFKAYGRERIDLFIDDTEYYAVNLYRESTEYGRW